LLYLTGETWTRGIDESDALAAELTRAMDLEEVNVLLSHEMPGVGGQEARHGCEFATFFSCPDGATPNTLLQRGIYSSIAIPLKGGPWRHVSMVLMGKALSMSKEEADGATESGSHDFFESSAVLLKSSRQFSVRRLLRRSSSFFGGNRAPDGKESTGAAAKSTQLDAVSATVTVTDSRRLQR